MTRHEKPRSIDSDSAHGGESSTDDRRIQADALETVALRLSEAGVEFLLGGSGLLAALGFDVEVRDIDLMLRSEDREAFEAAAGEWLVAVTTEPGPLMRSVWKATLDVGGVEVEGLGGLAMLHGGAIVTLPFRAAGAWRCGSVDVPLAAPEVWWAVYRAYKPDRAALLEPLVDPPAILAELGYDAVAERYLDAIANASGDPRLRFLDAFAERLPDGAEVLDLGCGAGRPNTERLAARFRVTGVDVSARQLALARERLPGVRLIQADMTELDLPAASFDGAVALYSIGHVARERHGALLASVAGWLRPHGLLLCSLPAGAEPGAIEGDWLGAPMFFSSFDPDGYRRLLAAAGFEPLVDEVVPMREADGRQVTFQWVLAVSSGARCR